MEISYLSAASACGPVWECGFVASGHEIDRATQGRGGRLRSAGRVMANRNAMPKSGLIDWRDLKPRILKRCQDALRNDLGFLRIEPVIRVVAEALEQSSRYDCVGLMLVKHA